MMMLLIFYTELRSPQFRVSLQTMELNQGTLVKSDNLNQYATIPQKRYKTPQLVLFTDRKSHIRAFY